MRFILLCSLSDSCKDCIVIAIYSAEKPSDDETHVDYVPTLFAFTPPDQKLKLQAKVASHERMVQRRRRMLASQQVNTVKKGPKAINVDHVDSVDVKAVIKEAMIFLLDTIERQEEKLKLSSINTDNVVEAGRKLDQAEKELEQTKKELQQAKEELDQAKAELEELKKDQLTWQGLENNDNKVLFYTGLPNFVILKMVFELALKVLPPSSIKPHGNRKLDNFTEFLITVAKLRLNLKNRDLAYRFGVSESVITNTIHKWINILYVALKFLIRWPSREEVRKTLPECFHGKFQKAVVIIDCTEIFIERATNLLARSQTWSNYKSHNTVKYLIGITPQGTISFVSEAWGGRASDKAITKESGILSQLLPGDLVLADRGFNIGDLVAEYRAEAVLPAFTKGKSQLSAKEVLESRELARVRIHVERLIGMVKQKYSILDGILPISFIKQDVKSEKSVADKLMVICCALINLCESIVPRN